MSEIRAKVHAVATSYRKKAKRNVDPAGATPELPTKTPGVHAVKAVNARSGGNAGFKLASPFPPAGDQPKAIVELTEGLGRGDEAQVLLGITGSGKTFSIANVIAQVDRPTLIIAHNKILAAQLYGEFKELFPDAAVHYFVSYYDYYQPEAYVPTTDTFIEKDSIVNEEIDRMRHAATFALLSRRDVIIVASVSCIYGIGARETYATMTAEIDVGTAIDRDSVLRRLIELQYERNDVDFHRGTFRVRGDTVEVFPAYEADTAIRIEWWGDQVEAISEIDPLRGGIKRKLDRAVVFAASHYATPDDTMRRAVQTIREELKGQLELLSAQGKLLERQRLEQRTMYDLESIEQMGFCSGIENYSRHLTGRAPGQPPPTLMDYFDDDYLLIIDESHQTVPQIGAMFNGDRSRKETLVEFGFRLPSALDNRPLRFDEWRERARQTIYVSATPAEWELAQAKGVVVEQIIRPTGLLDPVVEVRPVAHQVDDLLAEIRTRTAQGDRVLVTTLTKRMAEDLTEYYREIGVRVRYLHSDVDTLERIQIIRRTAQGYCRADDAARFTTGITRRCDDRAQLFRREIAAPRVATRIRRRNRRFRHQPARAAASIWLTSSSSRPSAPANATRKSCSCCACRSTARRAAVNNCTASSCVCTCAASCSAVAGLESSVARNCSASALMPTCWSDPISFACSRSSMRPSAAAAAIMPRM